MLTSNRPDTRQSLNTSRQFDVLPLAPMTRA